MTKKKSKQTAREQKPQEVTIAPEAWAKYKETICKHPPETVALLGGSLDRPFEISEFRFCPPEKNRRGEYLAGASYLTIDPTYMNFVVDHEWRPNGKYMLGLWHSHPGNFSRLSEGNPEKNEGDVVFFTSCLEADDSPERNWNHFIAPITTFDRDGNDQVHLWILDKGTATPRAGKLIIPELAKAEETASIPRHPHFAPKEAQRLRFDDYDDAFQGFRERIAAIEAASLAWDEDRAARRGLRRAFLGSLTTIDERGTS